ncbi:MAG: peptidase M28, partial [Acidobacteria bacterium]|nr:peptidase M28 [Acidobacteriota bacterium]
MKITRRQIHLAVVFLLAFALSLPAVLAQSKQDDQPDYAMIGKIREEGLNRSQVMDHIIWLSDVYGPRLTGSPAIKQAGEWTMKKFSEWGLANAHQESWPFGKGWSLVRFSAHMTEPQVSPLIGYPKSWTPGTNG